MSSKHRFVAENIINNLKRLSMKKIIKDYHALQKVRLRYTAVALCMVFFFFGCNVKEEAEKIDENSFLKNLESAPFVKVSNEDLPEWLNKRINNMISEFIGKPLPGELPKQAEVHRGKWNEQTVYNVWTIYSSSLICIFNENGENIEWLPYVDSFTREDFFSKSNNWELIFRIENGKFVGGTAIKSNMGR